jgi:hypothetical protein
MDELRKIMLFGKKMRGGERVELQQLVFEKASEVSN